jgi:predicted metal-binding membrane protein
MLREAATMSQACHCFGLALSGLDSQPWAPWQIVPLFLMWAEMMVAMMIPSAAPTILIFAAVSRRRNESARSYVSAGVFLAGYLAVWTLFSAIVAVLQWWLHSHALLSPMMESTQPWFGGALLVLGGAFQFTRWKRACLARCRSPLDFLMTHWREGSLGAFGMGWQHGLYCTGCCWVLMTLLFVAGVMNMAWVAAITVLVLLEKSMRNGSRVAAIAGWGFIGWGAWLLAGAAGLGGT